MGHVSLVPRIAVTLCCWIPLIFCSTVTLEGRGYKGIVVAINNDIPEDRNLVANIKDLFTNASSFLYTATRNGVYFKEVTIVVPPKWSRRPEYNILSGYYFDQADVRVDTPNDVYKDAPYTEQPGACGEPGLYIHLTPRFVGDVRRTIEVFGMPERQLVHEWAHLRYGVFNEYGLPGHRFYPEFYIENGRVRPTACPDNVVGWIESSNGGPCKIIPGTQQVDKDCMFIPDMEDQSAKASIMYMPFIPSVETFCDDGGSNTKHNDKAPTKQNVECNYESTWSVISRHNDFQNLQTAPAPSTLIPTFRIVQPPKYEKGRYVLVLDVSGSMKGKKIELLHKAATRLVEDRIPDGSLLGIVQFSSDAKSLHRLTAVTSATRQSISKSLPSTAGGSTAIGKGIMEGINVLRNGKTTQAAGVMIIVTDGEENVAPMIQEVIPLIQQEHIIVNAIAFGTTASAKIESVTTMTGGKAYFFSDLDGQKPSAALDSAFLESTTLQSDISSTQLYRLKEEMIDLQDAVTEKKVVVDNALGKNTVFTVTSQYINKVDVLLRSPTSVYYNSASREYSKDVNRRERIEVVLPRAESGRWTVSITRQGSVPFPVSLSVTSEPSSPSQEPIFVKSWLSAIQVNFPSQIKVYAKVKKGHKAVLGATVVAIVDGPIAKSVEINLKDDGVGADTTKNDGTYSGYFTQFNSNGRYAVVSHVVNDGNARVQQVTPSSGAPGIPKVKGPFKGKPAKDFPLTDLVLSTEDIPSDDDQITGDPAPKFERVADVGSFRLENWTTTAGDIIPPCDIRDLTVVHSREYYDMDITEVTLKWTSVGDDLDYGNAKSYELWASTDIHGLIKDVHTGFLIHGESIVNGSLRPMPPGSHQRVTVMIKFPPNSSTIYLAMKAKDEAGNVSPRYNVVAVDINIKKILSPTTTTTTPTTTTTTPTTTTTTPCSCKNKEENGNDAKGYDKNRHPNHDHHHHDDHDHYHHHHYHFNW